ncbi:sugar transferase [Solihabitans fulvus]|uniref:sugar transferase n=1 Tax=Solihabitans fulvus TaxID=1892852 RepID=UPI0027BAC79A|nr:sugar transferase [Solihabitans fulvus]
MANWEGRYRAAVICSDLLSTVVATLTAGTVVRHGLPASLGHLPNLLSWLAALAVLAALPATHAWDVRELGQGAEEFRRLGKALLTAAVGLALVGLAAELSHLRLWVFFVVPTVALIAFPLRYVLRRLLHARRRTGECLLPVMAAGSVAWVADLIERTQREPHNGWRIEAVCTPDGLGADGTREIAGIPVVGQLNELTERVQLGGYRVVAVAADPFWTPRRLQQLAWELEDGEAELLVAPVLMEVAGPRLHVTGVLGLPLLQVRAPVFGGGRRAIKAAIDRLGSAALLVLLAPLLITIALVIWAGDRGSVLYRQQRVGRDGKPFTILKFRTMVRDAEARLAGLRNANQGAGPLFKMREDPRITRAGRVLRRYSLDELPQLVNVLTGAMSLVGPRPPLPSEVATYGPDSGRRLLVKPGLTGLWQISGRSDLPWEEAIRLDLRYVEDWSLALDAVILWKTARVVFTGQGAY